MSGILDQEEIDALMGGLSSGQVEAGTDQPAGHPARYDFARQDYAVRRLLPAIAQIQSQFASSLQDRIRSMVSGVDAVRIDKITILKFDELVRTLERPCDIAVIKAAPLASAIYLAFESDLVFDLVDRFFGGRGHSVRIRARDDFSATERRFMESLGAALLPDLAAAWQPVLAISPTLQERQSDPRYLDELSDTDTLVATRFAVSIGEQSGGLWAIVPWSAVDPVRDRLGGPARAAKRDRDAQWRDKLVAGVEDSSLELVAVLSESKINLKRALQFKVGDIIAIDSPDEVALEVDGIPLFAGSFGTHDGHIAVKLEGNQLPKRRKS